MRRLLLISNSTVYGRNYLDHAESELREHLARVRRILFVPCALFDRDEYAAKARARFEQLGISLDSVHDAENPRRAAENAEAVFIGGGNTFRLLKNLYDHDLIAPIRARVAEGMPYVGSSAGSNVAGATIRTTNDMPIVQPPSFEALALVAFQLNCHYLDPHDKATHMGETREERIMQFHEENSTPVCGLREGSMLRVRDDSVVLCGEGEARIFRRGQVPVEIPQGTELRDSLSPNLDLR